MTLAATVHYQGPCTVLAINRSKGDCLLRPVGGGHSVWVGMEEIR